MTGHRRQLLRLRTIPCVDRSCLREAVRGHALCARHLAYEALVVAACAALFVGTVGALAYWWWLRSGR